MSTRIRSTVEPPCPPRKTGPLTSYAAIVDDYIKHKRPQVNAERLVFKHRSLKEAIRYAGLAKLPNGNRHPHQRRLNETVLAEAEQKLQKIARRLKVCDSFAELHDLIYNEIRRKGLGVLTVYDIASFVGAHLGLEPEDVYLHAGTRKGAAVLGLGKGQPTITRDDLPLEFKKLKPREIEDCLCSYAKDLRAIC